MRILYGVQGTGNGHISRARMMAEHLNRRDADVTFLFSGRNPTNYFDMEVFGDYRFRTGLTFATHRGRISYYRSLLHNRPLAFLRELRALDVSGYDLILTDFEPTTAWAGRLAGKEVIGFGHQYAFQYPSVPDDGVTWINSLIMRYFAPVRLGLGLHWAPFDAPILPPIINPAVARARGDQVVVYLPFERQSDVTRVLQQLPEVRFVQYSPELFDSQDGNVALRRTSLHGFKRDLQQSRAVICNAGFELISECLYMGLPVLAKPVSGQGEQLANVAALSRLQLAKTATRLDVATLRGWLAALPPQQPVRYPDVAEAVVGWLLDGRRESVQRLSRRLWAETEGSQPRRKASPAPCFQGADTPVDGLS